MADIHSERKRVNDAARTNTERRLARVAKLRPWKNHPIVVAALGKIWNSNMREDNIDRAIDRAIAKAQAQQAAEWVKK